MNDLEKTKHYTTKAQEICGNLLKYVPKEVLVDPFCGEGDLLSLFPDHLWECYDIENKGFNIVQDTLLRPPCYANKWIITNPPFLAKNKANNKAIFNQYQVDDLYKAALLSIMEAEGGIIILPTNFITDERSSRVRTMFLDQFRILEMNVFTEPIFETTTYSVCSFAFQRKEKKKETQNFLINGNAISLYPEYGYRLAGEVFDKLRKVNSVFSRFTNTSTSFITNIKLYALDSRDARIRLEYDTEHYCGKPTDRIFATLTCAQEIPEDEQKELIRLFNAFLEDFRKKYYDLPLTNYRDFNRKRIGFTFAYQILSYIYFDLYKKL